MKCPIYTARSCHYAPFRPQIHDHDTAPRAAPAAPPRHSNYRADPGVFHNQDSGATKPQHEPAYIDCGPPARGFAPGRDLGVDPAHPVRAARGGVRLTDLFGQRRANATVLHIRGHDLHPWWRTRYQAAKEASIA
jgi:hypothetical protein